MADFKDEFSAARAGALAGELVRAWPEFPRRRFTAGIGKALEPLALMDRVHLLAERLMACLPGAFPDAAGVLWRALDSPSFNGWITLPCGAYVARAGIDHPEVALPLLAGLTPRFSSEYPIRPFIEQHPAITFEHLHRWTSDEDEHVRRLVSEGTRPRLPWAPLLRGFIDDPRPNIPLLDRLAGDPSLYVRRSVANHLNDISKDHPAVALECARRWLGLGGDAAWTVRHGLRTLVKKGHPDALALLGVDHTVEISVEGFRLDRTRIVIGDAVSFEAVLRLAADEPGDVVIDYRVHYAGARGPRAPKVFKLTRRRLTPGVPVRIAGRHRFEHVSIRRIYPGDHGIDLQVNGRVVAEARLCVDEPR